MEVPFISVVIATYNRRELLRIALEALARQTYPADRFEVLAVSDGASDGTNEMVRNYAKTAPYRLRLITQENAGASRARNHGVDEASGVVIVFIDDDLEPLPEFLQGHARWHQEANVVVYGPIIADPKRKKTEPLWLAWEHAMLERNYSRWRAGREPAPGWSHFYSGNVSVRREHVMAVGGFDETLKRQEDVELGYRLARDCGVRFVFEEAAVGIHRPERGLQSWLKVPYQYGRIDVECARNGTLPWDKVWAGYHERSSITRLLATLTLSCPVMATPVRSLLLAGATACFRLGFSRLSMNALSVLYNLRYLEGARAELGAHGLRCLSQRDPGRAGS